MGFYGLLQGYLHLFYSERSILPFVEEDTPFPNTKKRSCKEQNFDHESWIQTGPETKKDCAGEDQRQFTGPGLVLFLTKTKTLLI
jgi:hypothetical protein